MKKITFTHLILAIGFSHTAIAQTYDSIAEFEDWGVFKDAGACWIATNPIHFKASEAVESFAFVSFFYGSHIPEISFYTPGCCGGQVSAQTSGYTMPLNYKKDTYFSAGKDETNFLLSLLRSSTVEIVDNSSGKPILSFSLAGFKEAYNQVSKICDFRPLNLNELSTSRLKS